MRQGGIRDGRRSGGNRRVALVRVGDWGEDGRQPGRHTRAVRLGLLGVGILGDNFWGGWYGLSGIGFRNWAAGEGTDHKFGWSGGRNTWAMKIDKPIRPRLVKARELGVKLKFCSCSISSRIQIMPKTSPAEVAYKPELFLPPNRGNEISVT